MTTVVGLSYENPDVVILASDRQGTQMSDGKATGKSLDGRKLFVSNDKNYALGHSGMFGEKTQELVKMVVEGKVDIRKVIETGTFEELREMNLANMGRKSPELDSLSSFLLMTRFDGKPKLHTCWPLGAVEPSGLTYIGSGSPRVDDYFKAREVLGKARNYASGRGSRYEVGDIIQISLEAVRYAQSLDIHSSGLDLLVATPEGIKDYETQLREDFFAKKLRSICKDFVPAKEKKTEDKKD